MNCSSQIYNLTMYSKNITHDISINSHPIQQEDRPSINSGLPIRSPKTQMASGFLFIAFSSFFFLFLFLFIVPSYGVPRETLAAICSQTQNQETCQSILLSDPRTDSAGLPLLSLISIEAAQKQADVNLQAFSSLLRNLSTGNPALQKAYWTCVSLYREIEKELRVAHRLSRQGKYRQVAIAGPSTDPVYECENGLPLSSPTAAITEDMLLTLQTFSSTAAFVARSH